jgi:hypothetical protein
MSVDGQSKTEGKNAFASAMRTFRAGPANWLACARIPLGNKDTLLKSHETITGPRQTSTQTMIGKIYRP